MASSLSATVGPTSGSRTFQKPDLEMKAFVIDLLLARGHDDPTTLTNQQLMNTYLAELVSIQRDLVREYRGKQELAVLEQEYKQDVEAAKEAIETEVDV